MEGLLMQLFATSCNFLYLTFYLTFVLFAVDSYRTQKRKMLIFSGFSGISVHQWTYSSGFKSHQPHQIEPRSCKAFGVLSFFCT